MTIEAELPDGTILEFPDGTDQGVIQNAVNSRLGISSAPSFPGAGVIEPALAIGSALVAEPLAGLAGIGVTAINDVGSGVGAIESVREALTFKPRTEAGKSGLETIGDLMQKGIDVVNFPLSGLAGIAELVTGQGVDQAAKTIKGIQEEGLANTLAERTFEETGSPIAATAVATAPEAIMARLGVRKAPGGGPDITPERSTEIAQTLQSGAEQGVPVLTSDIFNPESIVGRLSRQFSERIPLLGTGGRRGAQQTARIEAVERLDQSTPRIQASDIIDGLDASANRTRRAAGSRINNVVTAMDGISDSVPTGNAIRSIDDAVTRLSRPGKLPNQALIDELGVLRNTLGESNQNFSSLREFRTDARAIADSVDPKGRSQLRSGDKALLDSVISGITRDLDDFVLSNTSSRDLGRYKAADRIYAQEASKLTKSRLKTILDKGDVNPELVNNLLFSSSPSQVNLLFNNLDSAGRNNARMALMRNALDKSVTRGQLSPEKFVTQLNKLEDNFNVFFRGDARAEVQGIKRLLESTGRAAEAGVVTPTGQTVQASLAAGTIGAASLGDPKAISTLLMASTVGLANKAYESAGVRNMLIRLGNSTRRSTLEADLLGSIPLLLQTANQGIKEAEQQQGEQQ